jgi:hypothetical protein
MIIVLDKTLCPKPCQYWTKYIKKIFFKTLNIQLWRIVLLRDGVKKEVSPVAFSTYWLERILKQCSERTRYNQAISLSWEDEVQNQGDKYVWGLQDTVSVRTELPRENSKATEKTISNYTEFWSVDACE